MTKATGASLLFYSLFDVTVSVFLKHVSKTHPPKGFLTLFWPIPYENRYFLALLTMVHFSIEWSLEEGFFFTLSLFQQRYVSIRRRLQNFRALWGIVGCNEHSTACDTVLRFVSAPISRDTELGSEWQKGLPHNTWKSPFSINIWVLKGLDFG